MSKIFGTEIDPMNPCFITYLWNGCCKKWKQLKQDYGERTAKPRVA